MTKPIRIGLIGVEHWYSALPVAEGFADRPGVELVAVYDEDDRHAAEVAARFGVPRVESSWEAITADPGVDAVMSFVSIDVNPLVCLAAASAGKHILSTKPLARSLDEASRVLDAVESAGVTLLPAESRQRLGTANRAARRALTDGTVGRLRSASLSTAAGLPSAWSDTTEPGWFAEPDRTVGGAWVDHSIYQIDFLRWALGEEVASIHGTVASGRELPVEDYGVAVAVLDGGAVVTLEDTWSAPDGGFGSDGSFVGTAGRYRLDALLARDQAGDLDHWAAVIRGETEPIASAADAWNNLAVCLAFYESAATGRSVVPERRPR